MQGGEDWFMRPVLRGMCKYGELKDGSLDLLDVLVMNDAIDTQNENERRLMERQQRGR